MDAKSSEHSRARRARLRGGVRAYGCVSRNGGLGVQQHLDEERWKQDAFAYVTDTHPDRERRLPPCRTARAPRATKFTTTLMTHGSVKSQWLSDDGVRTVAKHDCLGVIVERSMQLESPLDG